MQVTSLFVCLLLCSVGAELKDDIKSALQRVADQMQAKYNMSIAASFFSPMLKTSVAAGYTDSGLGLGTPSRKALPDDMYVWGSTTKMFTAAAILQLVDAGKVSLTDTIAKHIDSILIHLCGKTLSHHFGESIQSVQIQHLLHMTSGLADYDGESYARDQFANRSKDFGPVEIIFNYVSPKLMYVPGTMQSYCSTNYILLGFVLANHLHKSGASWSWQGYNQLSVIPDALQKAFQTSKFVTAGTCKDQTPVHGFMESYSSASLPPQDVWNVSCVGGWTAGNYLGSVDDVARFSYGLWSNKNPRIVSASAQTHLVNFSAPSSWGHGFKFYGMGTFSLDWSIGDGEAYGHVGDTYGYQSQTTYFPEADFVISVATNVETSSQAQPADFTCLAYHEVKAVMDGTRAPKCTFVVPHRFIGKCSCSADVIV